MKAVAVVAFALACCAPSCARFRPLPAGAAPPYAEIYERATNQFAQADFFKPAEARTNDLAFTLAPLILQEVKGTSKPVTPPDQFCALSRSNGLVVLDPTHPALYWYADSVTVNGKAHVRLVYLWWHPSDGAESSLPVQGIRITLNAAGQPVICEVLADSSGAELIFVSQSLDAAAAARFGKPLPGRRYAIERSLAQAPRVIVPRVIDDGPVAMGPIVYLSAGTHTVSTLICRCMPAQVNALRTTSTYDLLPLQVATANLVLPRPTGPGAGHRAFWPGETDLGNRLEESLRLPAF